MCFCLRPSAKDLGITRVVVAVLVLFHSSHFLFKINLSGKNSSPPGIELGASALTTELQKRCCIYKGKLSISFKNFKNHAADLAPVLALVSSRNLNWNQLWWSFSWRGLYENGSERFWEKFYRKLFWAEFFFKFLKRGVTDSNERKKRLLLISVGDQNFCGEKKKVLGWKNESVMEADKLNLKSPVWSCLMFKKVSFAGPERQLTWLRFFVPRLSLLSRLKQHGLG